jgi:hypothetical protein
VLARGLPRQRGGGDAWAGPSPIHFINPYFLIAYEEKSRPVSLHTRIAAVANVLGVTALGWLIFRELSRLRTDWAQQL